MGDSAVLRRVRLIIALLAVPLLAACNSDRTLFSGLSYRDAAEMLVVLKRAGIEATLSSDSRSGTVSLLVRNEVATDAGDILIRAGLPRPKTASLGDFMAKDTWMASPAEERARLSFALSQDLTATLSKIPGVSEARVHVALAERNALGQLTTRPSASVLIRFLPDMVSADMAETIRQLVANAVSGLEYSKVTVAMLPIDLPHREKPQIMASLPLTLAAVGSHPIILQAMGAVMALVLVVLLIRRAR